MHTLCLFIIKNAIQLMLSVVVTCCILSLYRTTSSEARFHFGTLDNEYLDSIQAFC